MNINSPWLRGTDKTGIPLWRQFNKLLLANAQQQGFAYCDADAVSLSASLTQTEYNSQHTGSIQGAALCYCAETLANFAAALTIPDGYTVVGQSLNIHYTRSARGEITARAHCVHSGRKTSVWIVEMTDSEQKTVAHATFTGAVLRAG